MSMTDNILRRHSISRHQIVSAKLRDAYHGCVSIHDEQDAVKFQRRMQLRGYPIGVK
jgi:hypothetical protein